MAIASPAVSARGSRLFASFVVAVSALAPGASAAPLTTRVSVTSDEAQVRAGAAKFEGTAISPDGRFVLFESKSRELVPRDGAGPDLFVRDRRRGTTTIVTVRAGPLGPDGATGGGFEPVVSSDGRYVVFRSWITNLVARNTNAAHDIFVRDLRRKTTSRLLRPDGRQIDQGVFSPSISADGRYLTFVSRSAHLAPADFNDKFDVFLHDRRAGATRRMSKTVGGGSLDANSYPAAISANGRYIAFWSGASNLVPRDNNHRPDLFVRDRVDGVTVRATVSSTGMEAKPPLNRFTPRVGAISANGRYVAFLSTAANLVPDDTNEHADVFVRDLRRQTTQRVSVASEGAQVCIGVEDDGFGCNRDPAISPDGRFVAFTSAAPNLVAGDTNRTADVFVHDTRTRTTMRVSVDALGQQVCDGGRSACSGRPSISAGGRFVAFTSRARDVVPDDTNRDTDVFVRGPFEPFAFPRHHVGPHLGG